MARILIIDDELDLLKAMQKALVDAGHLVKVADDAREVIEGELGTDFDLVVTDMIMPGADGLEVLAYLYRRNPEIRIVAISGGGYFGSDFYLDLAAKFGAVMTLEKPFLLSELVRTVNAILGEAVGNCGPEGQDPEDPAGPPEQQVGFGTEKVVDIKTRRNLRSATKERRNLEKKAAASVLTIPPFLEPSFR